ncbi:hypothetical protein lerEdw1_018193 [Lerista edwardsae]|nr:hypothetical protein lerEdw1_018193 [Lerista edwardsae]
MLAEVLCPSAAHQHHRQYVSFLLDMDQGNEDIRSGYPGRQGPHNLGLKTSDRVPVRRGMGMQLRALQVSRPAQTIGRLDEDMGIQMLSVQPDTKPKGCAGCNRKIKDRYLLKALDKYWHEDCLKCACCDCRLGEVGSTLYTKANLILCRRDYLR